MKIIFDTNFLLYCAKYNLFFQLEEKYPKAKFVILDEILFELEKIKEKKFEAKAKEKIAASTALDYMEFQRKKGNLDLINGKAKDVDELILEEAKKLQKKRKTFLLQQWMKNLQKN